MAYLGVALNLGMSGSESGAEFGPRAGSLLLLGIGRCWWWLAPLAWLLTGSGRI